MVYQEFDPPSKHLVTIGQLWNSPWGYGGSSVGLDDGMSFEVGKMYVAGSMLFLFLWLHGSMVKRLKRLNSFPHFLTLQPFRPKADPPKGGNHSTIFLISGLLLSMFLMLPLSAPIWNSFPLLSYIQFPWRLLTFVSLFSSLLTTYTISIILHAFSDGPDFFKEKIVGTPEPRTRALRQHGLASIRRSGRRLWAEVSVVLGLILFITSYFRYFQPKFKFATTAAELTSRERIVWEVSRRSDEYVPKGFLRPRSLDEALRGGNLYNQRLVDDMKQPTLVRRLGNAASLLSLLFLVLVWKGQTSRRGLTF